MIRHLQTSGLCLLVFFAVVSLGASANAADTFTTTKESALLTSVTHNSVFQITGSGLKVECTTARFAAVLKNGSTEAEIDSEYVGKINETPHGTACSSAIGNVTLDTESCHTRSTGQTTGSDGGQTDATVWMECEAGKSVKITSSLGFVGTA